MISCGAQSCGCYPVGCGQHNVTHRITPTGYDMFSTGYQDIHVRYVRVAMIVASMPIQHPGGDYQI